MPHTLQHTFAFQSWRSLELFGERFRIGGWKRFEGSYVALKSRTNAKAVEKTIEKILENSYVVEYPLKAVRTSRVRTRP